MESLLITGGSGFVGQSLLDYLATLESGFLPNQIALVTRASRVLVPEGLENRSRVIHIQADLLKPWEFEFPATHVIHLAADGSASAYSARAAVDFVTMATHLGAWSAKLGDSRVFHASSGACFEMPVISGGLNSESKLSQGKKSQFIQSRLVAEDLLNNISDKGLIDLRIGRLFSFIGRHLFYKPHYAVSAFTRMAVEEKVIEVEGAPLTTRSYLSASDMSEWIFKSLTADVGPSILSVGSNTPVTMSELASHIASKTGASVQFLNPSAHSDYYVADNEQTRLSLQVEERLSWQTSVEQYLDSYDEMRAGKHG